MAFSDIQRHLDDDIARFLRAVDPMMKKVLFLEPCLERLLFLSGTLNATILSQAKIQALISLKKGCDISPHLKNASVVLFLVRPSLSACQQVGHVLCKIQKNCETPQDIKIHLCFSRQPPLGCVEAISHDNPGILLPGAFLLPPLDIGLIPVDGDVLTMEESHAFHELFVTKNISIIRPIAHALLKLQAVFFGRCNNVTAHGQQSCAILRLMKILEHSYLHDAADEHIFFPESDAFFDSMIIVDRTLDPVSPLLSENTYEGILDTILGIELGNVDVPEHIANGKGDTYGTVQLWNTEDAIFARLRYLTLTDAGKLLNEIACEIQNDYNDRHEIQKAADIYQFVRALPVVQKKHFLSIFHSKITDFLVKEARHRGVDRHFAMEAMIACDEVDFDDAKQYVEECVLRKMPLEHILRIIFLLLLCSSSWNAQLWGAFKELLVDGFGVYDIASCIATINACEFFHERQTKNLRAERFAKVPSSDGWPAMSHQKSAMVYSSSLLTEAFAEVLEPSADFEQKTGKCRIFNRLTNQHAQITTNRVFDSGIHREKVHMLFIVGGISLAEIRAVRSLEQALKVKSGENVRIIMASTNVINGAKFVQSVFDEQQFRA